MKKKDVVDSAKSRTVVSELEKQYMFRQQRLEEEKQRLEEQVE